MIEAEWHIRLIQDFIGQSNDDNQLQDTIQVVQRNRQQFTKDRTKADFS